MRADRVKPGMLVRPTGAGWWLVGGVIPENTPGFVRLRFADGRDPMQFIARDEVEAVRLTEAQERALRMVASGGVHLYSSPGIPWRWMVDGQWQPLAGRPYDTIAEFDLVTVGGEMLADGRKALRRDVTVTPSGRALLDILGTEKP